MSRKLLLLIFVSIVSAQSVEARSWNEAFWGSTDVQLKGKLRAAQRVKSVPEKINKQFPNKKVRVFSIDLDSDGRSDFIVWVEKEFQTCFFDSAFIKKSCEKLGVGDGFSYNFFVQLDSDPMLELFSFSGDEDYSDYKLLKFDAKSWKLQPLFEVQPLIKSQNKTRQGIYWGYPWDITDIIFSGSGSPKILATFAKDPNPSELDTERKGPKILFEGIPTQGDAKGSYSSLETKFEPKLLKDLVKEASARH